jgi:hypothetical protein
MDAYCSLDIFEMAVGTNEPSKKNVEKDLLIFKHYQVDVKEITCPLDGGRNMKCCFP